MFFQMSDVYARWVGVSFGCGMGRFLRWRQHWKCDISSFAVFNNTLKVNSIVLIRCNNSLRLGVGKLPMRACLLGFAIVASNDLFVAFGFAWVVAGVLSLIRRSWKFPISSFRMRFRRFNPRSALLSPLFKGNEFVFHGVLLFRPDERCVI